MSPPVDTGAVHARRSEAWSDPAIRRAIANETARLARRLRALREQRGLSQEEAAEFAHLDRATVYRAEHSIGNLTVATLVALAHAYGLRGLRALFETDRR